MCELTKSFKNEFNDKNVHLLNTLFLVFKNILGLGALYCKKNIILFDRWHFQISNFNGARIFSLKA